MRTGIRIEIYQYINIYAYVYALYLRIHIYLHAYIRNNVTLTHLLHHRDPREMSHTRRYMHTHTNIYTIAHT